MIVAVGQGVTGSPAAPEPALWVTYPLERIAQIERGKFSARPRNDPRFFEGGTIPFIQTGDVASAKRFVDVASQFLNDEGLGVSKRFPAGTIFITIAANIGDVAMARIPMACPDSVVGVVADAAICDPVWLYYALSNSKSYFENRATQNAQKNINLQVLKPFPIALPAMAEQHGIANVLTAVDDKLDAIARQIEVAETLKKGLMQTLFSRGLGVRDASGRWTPHKDFSETPLGKLPASWSVAPIGQALEVVERPVSMDHGAIYRRVTVKRRYGGVEMRDERPASEIKVKSQFRLEAGDFLISERQIVHGACGIVPEHLAGALVSNEYLVLKARDGVDVRYFSYLVQLLKYAKLFLQCSQGVDIEKFLFKPKDWLKKLAPIPPLAEQERIVQVLSEVEAKLKVLQDRRRHCNDLKRGLMQKLLTGEWRVKVGAEIAA